MATLTIKNIPEELCMRLKESAAQHCRSINGEAISCLEKVLVGNPVDPHDFLARACSARTHAPRVSHREGASGRQEPRTPVIVADTNLICEFVALAHDLGVPLVTSDSARIAKFKPTVVSVRAFCS